MIRKALECKEVELNFENEHHGYGKMAGHGDSLSEYEKHGKLWQRQEMVFARDTMKLSWHDVATH